ncbi:D-alanyl-lipoteichoic acid acyltransferase DltB (MBOAT superfamily) [Aquimarina sp. EL_43]|uniref:MBOAT family O-acyltransferase n=1 Tax=unclassified Aquimarina TaxID=2627091 RepID=UPI0018CB3EDD|nr:MULTISPECIES: MBOAT family protein [unclassified Aquimarina]MBG6133668.1 D-alanyl-lipoteichoic acid acyltransferase DltB (MBOAT superfamily) [Aquimarina sp. EL_35]MBG6153861.1 D-alanyl-lipoteichoic acid acyltransferase DltB (MBOAT superfamily) [Aquimarina sp. EL_32]MBG6172041.1 D-alanyl-lipoteichoic acid acyltransferase DltB (MBOAT superfamily) [Aquimarina sp. EL_43]
MVFNSLDFVVFIIPVFLLYWLVFNRSKVYQNIFLLGASLFFYTWADWRFLALLIGSTLINYYLGLKIFRTPEDRKKSIFLYIGLVFNVGLLLYFKYFNFFYEGFYEILNAFGSESTYNSLVILLPLGISFFTFQTLGYLIDVYNEEIEPSENLLEFSVFVTFFPKILSGPIERASSLIPQIQEKRVISYEVSVDGLRQILWGLFAKIVVAENCALIANPIFNNYENESGSTLLLGTFFYAIQLYADFSGYSNMAIGVSKLFGIQLMRNFSTPFFSTNISDFWRKWHMSLTTWMMDYVFTPLSFTLRRHQKKGLIISIITTFVLVGFWHGANWTFVVYGLLHGIYFVPLVFSGKMNTSEIVAKGKMLPSVKEIIKMILLFVLIMLTDVFFRVESVSVGFEYLQGVFSLSIIDLPSVLFTSTTLITIALIGFFMLIEWINREKKHDFEIGNYNIYLRWISYISIFVLILIFGKSAETFIYFQF